MECRVLVELADQWGIPQTASWSMVRMRALNLAEQCLKLPKKGTFSGGWTTLGEQDGLRIVLQHDDYADDMGIGGGVAGGQNTSVL